MITLHRFNARTVTRSVAFFAKLSANLIIALVMVFSPFSPLLPLVQKAHAIPGGIRVNVARMTVNGPQQDQVAEIYIECNDSSYVDIGATDGGGSLNVYPADDDLTAAGCSNGDTIYGKAVADGYVTHVVSGTVIGTYAPLNFTGDDSLLPQLEVLVSDTDGNPIEGGANVTFGGMGPNGAGANEFLFPYSGTNSVSVTSEGYLDADDPTLASVALTPDAQTVIYVSGSSDYSGGGISGGGDFTVKGLVLIVPGCTDPGANNYNAAANQDDASCTYGGGGGGGGGGGPTNPTVIISHTIGSLTQVQAFASGSVTDAGGGTISDEGFVYDTATHSADPSLYATTVHSDPSGSDYTNTFESLSCGTTYYYRAFAANEAGTSTSDEASFKTPSCDATVALNNAGLVAHWAFDGDVSDASSGANNGSINGSVDAPTFSTDTTSTTTFANTNSVLASTTSEIDVTNATNLNFTGSFTIAFWLKPTVWNDGGTHGIISKVSSDLGDKGFSIQNEADAGSQISFAAGGTNGGTNEALNADIDVGQWQHLAVVYDAAEKSLSWYKNGLLTGKYNGIDLGDLTNTDNLELLHTEIEGGGYYQGGLDDVRMYNSALTGAQIAQLGQGYDLAAFTGGDGTSGNPYQIASCDDLAAVNNNPNADYILEDDLTCGAWGTQVIMGTAANPFTGTFNGNNHAISVTIDGLASTDVGLFGVLHDATVHNLKISGTVAGQTNVGALAGLAEDGTTISKVESTVAVTVAAEFAGGLVGILDTSSITDSYNTGAVYGGPSNDEGSASYLGGLVGKMTGAAEIETSYATGNVTGWGETAGLVAQATDGGAINDSFAVGAIDADADAGGLVSITQGGTGAVTLSNDFDGTAATYCVGDNTEATGCTAESASALQNVKNVAPFTTTWSFTDTWATSGTYPVLRAIDGAGTQGPDITITAPEDSSSIISWTPSISWGDATTCYYQFDGTDSYVAMGSCDNSIPSPGTEGSHVLNIEASNGAGTTTESSSFTYTPPTEIGSCADFEAMDEHLSGVYVLTHNLDCTADGNDVIVGSSTDPFTGSFDGAGHRITVQINNSSTDYTGLFGKLSGATVSNLWVDGSVIATGSFTGAIAGSATASTVISKVKSTADVTGGGSYTGGIVGDMNQSSDIEDSYSTGIISGWNPVGGIAGDVYSSVLQRDYFAGTVTGSGSNVGGIVGVFNNSEVHHDFSVGAVSSGGINAGGIIGDLTGGSDIVDNYWDGVASGQTNCIGGDGPTGSVDGCEDINTDGSGASYLKGNHTNAPFTIWDFDAVWQTNTAAYPTLQEFAGVPRDITVNTLLDDGSGHCSGGGECTFRDAISTAGEGDTVKFQYGLTGSIVLTQSAEIDVNHNIHIVGPGQNSLAIDFNNDPETYISFNNGDATTTVSGLTFKNCENTDLDENSSFDTAALAITDTTFEGDSVFPSVEVFNHGALSVTDSTFLNNTANTDSGGAIFSNSDGDVTIASSTFDGNSFNDGADPSTTYTNGGGAVAYEGFGDLTISSSTFNGNTSYDGGAIFASHANLITIATSTFVNNYSTYWVGAIETEATNQIFITGSTFIGNHADNAGYGIIYTDADPAFIFGSTFSGNTVTDNVGGIGGGAIYNLGFLGLENDTFSGNLTNGSSTPNGGALDNDGTAEILNSTFANDSVDGGGSGGEIFNNDMSSATTTIINSILAGGTPSNCGGTVASNGNNIDSGSSCNFTLENDFSNTDPLFATAGLADYGGPVKTIAIQPSSPAIDSANGMAAPATDARGIIRPQDGNNDGNAYADIGAFEYVYGEDESGGAPHIPGVGNQTYRYVKWEITKDKGTTDDGFGTCAGGCIQASEFRVMEDGSSVAWPDGTVATNPGGNNPGGQDPSKMIDGDNTTKWLDHNFDSGFGTDGHSTLIIDTGEGQSVTFNGYEYATGDDWAPRDPVSWNVYGSNDGTAWTLIDTKTDQTVTDNRDTATDNYTSFTPAFTSGTGSVTDPFQISTCGELEAINTNLDKAYLLTADLDCHLDGNAALIGSSTAPFSGVFDGAGYTVTVAINSGDSANGLFEFANGATIKNINVAGTVAGGNQVGGLIGRETDSTISHVSSGATVSSDSGEDIGGLIGYADGGTITDAYASGNVSGNINIGGLIGGLNNPTILNTYAIGTVTGNGAIGGLLGAGGTNAHSVLNSFAAGTVTLTGEGDVGGLSGNVTDGSTFVNSWYSEGNTGQTYCNGSGSQDGCTAEFSDGEDQWFYDKTHAPLSSWDFGGYVWNQNDGSFPSFVAPFVVAPVVTASTTTFVTTGPTTQQATFNGTIVSLGGTTGIYDRGFQYGTTTDYASSTDEGIDGEFTAGDFSLQAEGLMCNTTYHFRAFTTDSLGTIYSADATFTTDPCETITIDSPTVNTTITESDWNPSVEWSDAFVTCEYAYDDNDYTALGSCGDTIPAPGTAGAHTLHVRGTDESESQATASADFTYEPQNTFDGLGSGTSDDPYQITTCLELQEMDVHDNASYELMNNIDCSDTENWNDGRGFGVIGFGGVLDGKGYSIQNLYMNRPTESGAGLFSYFGGVVFNLNMDGGSISGESAAGSVVGESYGGFIAGVSSNADVTALSPGEGGGAGGLVGFEVDSTVIRSSYTGTVEADGMSLAGGLVGVVDRGLDMEDSFASSTELAFGTGGLVGFVLSDYDGVTISTSYAAGTEYGFELDGGLVGVAIEQDGTSDASTTISSSFSTATLVPFGEDAGVGGIYGYLDITNPVFNSAYYDQTASAGAQCIGENYLIDGDPPSGADGCTAINTDGTDGSHYVGTSSPDVTPLGDFNFDSIWQETDGELPQLQTNAIDLSLAPTALTIGTLDGLSVPFSWVAPTNTGGVSVQYYQYFVEPSGADLNPGDDGTVSDTTDGDATSTLIDTVGFLGYNTSYDVRVRAHTSLGYGAWTDPVTVTFGDTPTHQITSCDDLLALENDPYIYADNIELENDIDCSGVDNFAPLGNSWLEYFMGDFNGQHHTINNLTINFPDESNVGLFTQTYGSTLENVNFGTTDGGSSSVTGQNAVGALVGWSHDTTIDNVTSTVDVTGNTDGGGYAIGGLVGEFDVNGTGQEISSSTVTANITGEAYMGGIVGYLQGSDSGTNGATINIQGDSYTGNISGDVEGDGEEGGLIGEEDFEPNSGSNTTNFLTISDSHSSGSVSGSGYDGGLIGEMYSYASNTASLAVSLSRVYSSSVVSGTWYVGGLVGYHESGNSGSGAVTDDTSESYASGNITSTDGRDLGGLEGEAALDSTDSALSGSITDSYASGSINATGSGSLPEWVGGLIGDASGFTIDRTYATGQVIGARGVGGLIGALDAGSVSDSFSTGAVTGVNGATVIGGFIGLNPGNTLTNDYYDAGQSLQGAGNCQDGGVADGCTPIIGDLTHFINTSSVEPFSSGDPIWDFDTTWATESGKYPQLRNVIENVPASMADITPPVITLLGPAQVIVYEGQTYTDQGATATDNVDGNLTNSINTINDVDISTPGTYTVTYDVSDSSSNAATEVTRTVIVKDPTDSGSVINTPQDTDIYVPISLTNGTVDLSSFASDSTHVTIPNSVTIYATTTSGVAQVHIPRAITITSSVDWSGILNLPQPVSVTVPPSDASHSTTVASEIEIGNGSSGMTFNRGVRLDFPGLAGKLVGWTTGDAFTQVTAACTSDTQDAGDALADGGDCKVDVGGDLVIWTKHFTTYAVYSESAVSAPPSGGGGGGSGQSSGGSVITTKTLSAVATPLSAVACIQVGSQTAPPPLFGHMLKLGVTDSEVEALQVFLNVEGYTVARTGAGSIGHETKFFGPSTYAALVKFQEAHTAAILTTIGLTHGSGIFGSSTMKFANTLAQGTNGSCSVTATTSTVASTKRTK